MKRCCVVVADRTQARLFLAEPVAAQGWLLSEKATLANPEYEARGQDAPQTRVERNTDREAGPVHPQFEKRVQHRLELERRFARDIVAQAGRLVHDWPEGTVLVVADPHMLGVLAEEMQSGLPPGLVVRRLARNYVKLAAAELAAKLDLAGCGEG